MKDNVSKINIKIQDVKELGELIRNRRKSLALTQAHLASVCGVGMRFLSELENGKPTVEFAKVLLVLQGLGLEIKIKNKGWD